MIAFLRAQRESAYARRAGFLYEWITGKELDVAAVSSRASYALGCITTAVQWQWLATDRSGE